MTQSLLYGITIGVLKIDADDSIEALIVRSWTVNEHTEIKQNIDDEVIAARFCTHHF